MDDTPQNFLQELKFSVLKKRVGLIALAVVLASAVIQFISDMTHLLIMPVIARALRGHTETVLFPQPDPFPIQRLVASVLQFVFSVLAVFYLNRWMRGYKAPAADSNEGELDPSLNVDLGSLASGPKDEPEPGQGRKP